MNKYTNSTMDKLINEHIHSIRDRRILHRRFIDGICYEKLAEEFDMSARQIKAIVYRSEKELIQHM